MARATGRCKGVVGLASAVAVLVAMSGACPAAQAATATASFTVTATVQATCLISAGNMDFGTYTGVVAETTSTITITCTNTTPYDVGLSVGLGSGATVTTRSMANGAAALGYGLFRDSNRTLNWGETVTTDTLAGTGDGTAQDLTVYGRIDAGQFVTPGAYADTITATITY